MLYHPEPRDADDRLASSCVSAAADPSAGGHLCRTVPPARLPDTFEFSFHPSDASAPALRGSNTAPTNAGPKRG